uniref:RRM domain-containing protein n=1 Tax=Solanum lycopersicum TaxID=4081 RepID=A0A3Q7FVZ9_SOLLC
MTNYGTIPTSSSGPVNVEFISRAKDVLKEGLAARRPWKEMFNFHSFNLPSGVSDAISRIKTNFSFFQTNYAIIVLVIVFLSLLWHPISLIVFIVLMAIWLFLYFLRDEPLVIFGRLISDSTVLIVLSVLTLALLLFTGATSNILISLAVGVFVVLIHASIRKTDDLFLDEEGEYIVIYRLRPLHLPPLLRPAPAPAPVKMAHLPAYDPYYVPQPVYAYKNEQNDIKTLFVSGLPDDVKAREIHNLFRRRHGFESCQLKYTGRGNQVVAFATFIDHPSAMAPTIHNQTLPYYLGLSIHLPINLSGIFLVLYQSQLQGVKFDPQTGSTLHIEPARSNSRRIQIPGRGPYVVIDNRNKFNEDAEGGTSSNEGDNDSDDASEPENPDSGTKDDSSEEKREEKVVEPDHALAPKSEQNEKTTDGAQPCSTLFIANLGPNCTEDELKQVVSQYSGFNTLKVRARGGMPVAFADFEGVEQATKALNELQGSTLPSSDRGGMHIEYARSKMRKP